VLRRQPGRHPGQSCPGEAPRGTAGQSGRNRGRGGESCPVRTYTIAEAAEATGLTEKAIRSRVDRGSIRAATQGGVRRIPAAELIRAGLLDASGETAPRVIQGQLPRRGSPAVVVDVNALVARIETLTTEVAEHRLLASQAENAAKAEASAREVAEAALHEMRARAEDAERAATRIRADLEAAQARLAEVAAAPAQSGPGGTAPRRWWAPWRRPSEASPASS
jgi:excisionase family DNA binding protein